MRSTLMPDGTRQIYFCRFIIEPYLQQPEHSRFINKAVLDRYWEVGGVRIEGRPRSSHPKGRANSVCTDNVLVTENGHENLTTAVKEVAEMERITNGEQSSLYQR